jgi:hypothetical protein
MMDMGGTQIFLGSHVLHNLTFYISTLLLAFCYFFFTVYSVFDLGPLKSVDSI